MQKINERRIRSHPALYGDHGPIVGHYRVNKIGADGSLIIGCHEFDATEAKRLHALLESCEACASVTAEIAA